MVRTRYVRSLRMAVLRGLMAGTVLAASHLAAASPVVSEDVPVPGGIAALAEAIGLNPVPDPARLAEELARLVYDDSKARRKSADSTFQRLIAYFENAERSESAPTRGLLELACELVPMPLTAGVWSQVLRRPVTSAHLFAAVMSNSSAARLVHGLAALVDDTLQFLVEHPTVVRCLYEDG